jgi:hypothetical protein
MRFTLGALLALPLALRVAAIETAGSEDTPLNFLSALGTNLRSEADQAFIEEVCPDYTSYARIKQYVDA